MLISLNISNFVLINQLSIEFGQGLNVLTGETGSGKSIIVDALGLLMGERAGAELIRTGTERAFIEGTFNTRCADQLKELLEVAGIEIELPLTVRREMSRTGRTRALVCDQVVSNSLLRTIQPFLVEIYGQGDQSSLISRATQTDFFDNFAGLLSIRRDLMDSYNRYREALSQYKELEDRNAELNARADLLRFQLSELESLQIEEGEDERLEAERKLLASSEKLLRLSQSLYGELYEFDESIVTRLATLQRQLSELITIDQSASHLQDLFESVRVTLTDAAETLRSYSDQEFSEERLMRVEERLAQLQAVKRKHNKSLSALSNMLNDLKQQLSTLENFTEREEELRAEVAEAGRAYSRIATKLRQGRVKAVKNFEQSMETELAQVGLEGSRFVVRLEDQTDTGPAQRGGELAEFLISTNKGEAPRPLSRTASGGELSRIMLTIRIICGTSEGESVVFDEIDTGIGGRAAEAVGRRLRKVSENQQVLCVTHQPQIARFASRHYVVSKQEKDGRTATEVTLLSGEERVEELTRMIGGEEGNATREAARWLIESATPGKRRANPR
jgi:DNA repair protein RecN (Recombination protein N)